MLYKFDNRLQRSFIRACSLILFLLALGLGETSGAYLPVYGPAPLRFRPIPAPSEGTNAAALAVTGQPKAQDMDPAQPGEKPIPDVAVVPISLVPNPASAATNSESEVVQKEGNPVAEDAIYPQFLVPFFTEEATNNPRSNVRIVEFNPPVKEAQRSSRAIYKSE